MVDVQTGRICFDGGLTIIPSTTIDDLRGFVDIEKDKLLGNGPWKTFSIRNMSLMGHPISLSASFKNDRIRSLHLSCITDPTSWADYSFAKEAEIKVANDELLEKLLGKKAPQRFSWGVVESLLDSKTGDAGIVIRYES